MRKFRYKWRAQTYPALQTPLCYSCCLYLVLLSFLCFSSTVFSATDDYFPLNDKKLQAGIQYGYIAATGRFIDEGKFSNANGSPSQHRLLLSIKRGLPKGFEASVDLSMYGENDEARDFYNNRGYGLLRPSIGLKYSHKPWPIFAFADAALPLASQALEPSEVGAIYKLGSAYLHNQGAIKILLGGYYQWAAEDSNSVKQNSFAIYAKPIFEVGEELNLQMKFEFLKTGEQIVKGKDAGHSGYLVTVTPGFVFRPRPSLALEVNLPYSALGSENVAEFALTLQARLFI